jgi:predicted permease
MRSLLRRLWFRFRRDRLDAQLRDEIEWHLERRAEEFTDAGLDRTAAREAALRAFGNPTRVREESRDFWSILTLDLIGHDVRFAVRTLARQPALALIAVGSLGAAMAAAIAVFGLANAVLFDTLPVPQPDRLVMLRWVAGPSPPYESLDGWSSSNDRETTSTSFSYAGFLAAREAVRGRADLFGFADLYQIHFGAGAEPPQVATGQVVSGNYFSALGLRPAAGRLIGPDDDRADAEPVAVVSHALWRGRLGARQDVVGLVVRINGVPTTIVGVAPPRFNGTRQVGDTSDVTLPLALRDRFVRQPGDQRPQGDARWWWVIMMARLAPEVEPPAVQPAIEGAIRQTFQAHKDAGGPFRVELNDGSRGMTEERRVLVEPVAIMAGIVVLVVLIACANLANLLLARGASRDREVAVRLALGASRGHIVGQLLVESVIIGLAAAAIGVVVAAWLAGGLLPALGLESDGLELSVNGRILAFTAAAAFICAILFGLAPAWRGSDVQPVRGLKEGSGGNRVPRLRLARVLLVAQIALSVVILVAAGLLARTMQNLERVEPGFDPRGLLTFRVDPTLNGYDEGRIRALYTTLLERLRALPGVERASFSHHGLLYGWSSRSSIETLEGRKLTSDIDVNRLIVDRDFFETVGIPLVAGRHFSGLEGESRVRQVLINQQFARTGFNTETPLGRRFQLGTSADAPTYEIIGVVGDARIVRLKDPVPPTVYFSYKQEITYAVVFALRTTVPPGTLSDAVRRTVASVDPDLPVARLRTQEEQIAFSLRRERLFAGLATALAGLALVLACIGLYGLMAYAVSRRTPEIGIRMALGAARGRVLRMIVWDAARLMAAGLAIGVGAAVASGRYLENQLFGLTPSDPRTQAFAVALLAAVALAAAYVPARRASRVDPLIALKYE